MSNNAPANAPIPAPIQTNPSTIAPISSNAINYNNLQERNTQVLNDISQLQTSEQALYDSLDDPNLDISEKQTIIRRINEISQMRLNMFANVNNMYSFYQQNISASRDISGEQLAAIEIIEKELNETKRRMNLLKDQQTNKLRMVEINTYYGKRYNAHTKIMKIIVVGCIPIILLSVLASKGYILPNIYAFLIGLIIVTIGFLLVYQLIDISNRDNMNWDEYSWKFNKTTAPAPSMVDPHIQVNVPWSMPAILCVGSSCCSAGSTYDSVSNTCMPNVITPATVNSSATTASTTVTDATTTTATNTGLVIPIETTTVKGVSPIGTTDFSNISAAWSKMPTDYNPWTSNKNTPKIPEGFTTIRSIMRAGKSIIG